MKSSEFVSVEHFKETLDVLVPKLQAAGVHASPHLGVVCGSGLGKLVEALDQVYIEVPYTDLPHFCASTVVGHSGKMVFGRVFGLNIVVMVGRLHYYEGYSQAQISFPVSVVCLLGIRVLLLTNAAGGLNTNYKKGDMMILHDHVSFPGVSGNSSIRGPLLSSQALKRLLSTYAFPSTLPTEEARQEEFSRFPSLHQAYPKQYAKLLATSALEAQFERSKIHSGVYLYTSGPAYESLSELRLFKEFRADAVGMSTVPEVLMAVQMNVSVVAFSLISNEIPDHIFPKGDDWLFEQEEPRPTLHHVNGTHGTAKHQGDTCDGPTHTEVIEATNASATALIKVIRKFAENLAKSL